MRTAPKFAVIAKALVRPALWFCASNLLVAVLAAQCTNVSQVPNQTISSGTSCYSNNDTLTASGVTINGSASVSFVAGHTVDLTPGFHATAGTAGTTFHAWVETAPSVISVFPSSGSGLSQPFTWTVSSPSGYSNLSDVFALFNTSVSGVNACYIHYNRASNLLYLADNSGTNWLGGFVPLSSGSAGNSYCTIYGTGSSVNTSGNQLSLTVNVAFQSASFSGTKNSYLNAIDGEGLYTGLQPMGTWTVAGGTGFTPIRISAGGPYTDSLGQYWAADYGYLQGSTYSTGAAITGTPDQRLYQTERWNQPVLTYQFSVPNGNYTVTLKFAEIYDTAPGQRYMNATLNGTTVFTYLDVWTSAGGPNRAYDLSYPVSVTNGQLTITLNCASPNNSAEVNAIQIVAGTTQQYYLTTAVSPSGAGTISPASGWYNSGSFVTITATPATGYHFTGFTGSVNSGSNPLSVAMNSSMTETANFAQNVTYYPLTTTVSPSGGGTVNPSCPGGCSYGGGSPVTITATPASGYQFNGFTGSINSGANPLTVTLNSAMTETANFTAIATQYQLTTSVSPAGTGTLTFNPPCCAYNAGTQVQITATPASGYLFSGFSGALSGTTNPQNLTITGSVSVTASFTSQLPNLSQMALWSAFVDRHELFVGPNGPSGSGANGGLYGLSGTDIATVNTLVDSANQQLGQLQTQVQSLDAATYLSRRSTILTGLNTQLRAQVSQQSAQIIDQYVNTFLEPRLPDAAVPSTSGVSTADSQKCPSGYNCLYLPSEINFYNGGGANYGLGAYSKSWVEGGEVAYFTSSVTGFKEWWSPQTTPPPPGDSSWQLVLGPTSDTQSAGKGAAVPHTEANPKRGSYMIESFHGFVESQNGQVLRTLPPFGAEGLFFPPSPPQVFNPTNGYDYYQTAVDLQLQVGTQTYATGQTAVVTTCSSPITVQAILMPALPSANQAPPLTWTGGTTVDNLRRTVPCQPGQTTIQVAFGTNLTTTVSIKVVPTMTFLPTQGSIGVQGYMLTIQGTNLLGSGPPSLDFGNSGITYTIQSYDNYEVTGFFNVPATAQPGQYTVTLTPGGTTVTATAALTLVPGPSTLTGQYPPSQQALPDRAGIWWLGAGAPDSNEGCDPNRQVFVDGDAACYWTWVTVTLTPGAGASPPSPGSPVTWSFTDAATNQPAQLLAWNCLDAPLCSQIAVRPSAAFVGTINVRATLNGILSTLFKVDFDYPGYVVLTRTEDKIWASIGYPAYQSDNYLQLFSAADQPMFRMPVHEEFPSPDSWSSCGNSVGWTVPIPQTDPDPKKAWGSWVTLADGTLGTATGPAPDTVVNGCPAGSGCAPLSDIPGSQKVPSQPLSPQANAWSDQYIVVGSQTTNPLGRYIRVRANRQVRYTDHGRDELGTWICPQ